MGRKASSSGSCFGSLGLARVDRLRGLALVGCVQCLRHSTKSEGGGDGDSGGHCGGNNDEHRCASYSISVAQVAVFMHLRQGVATATHELRRWFQRGCLGEWLSAVRLLKSKLFSLRTLMKQAEVP